MALADGLVVAGGRRDGRREGVGVYPHGRSGASQAAR